MPTRRIALLENPESGSGEAGTVERALRDHGAEVDVYAIEDAHDAGGSGAERIVVAGGDGSIGLAAEVASRAGVPLAVIPVGTANDFAAAFGLPEELDDACELAVRGEEARAIELARMDGRPFVNVSSLGLPPAAARRASGLKSRLGPLAYAVGAVRAGLTAQPVRCRVRAGDGAEVYSGEAWQATIACSGAFGGGSRLDTDPSDGMLDAVVVEAGSRLRLGLHARGMRTGTLEEQDGVHRRRAESFEVEVGPETSFNLDGELCVQSGTVRFTVDAAAVEVIVG